VASRQARAVLSVGCELVSAGRMGLMRHLNSGHEALPLGQGGRAAELVSFTIDEVTFLVEMVVDTGMN
jgi:hypothetical protein